MPLDLGDVLANRRTIGVPFQGSNVKLSYDSVKYTSQANANWTRQAEAEEARAKEDPHGPPALSYVDFMLLDLVSEWDLEAHTDECRNVTKANGEPCRDPGHRVPVDVDSLRRMPVPLKVSIARAIERDLVPNDQASSPGSSRAGGGATSPNGAASFVQPGG